MIFTAKCYWPCVTREELATATARATREAESATRPENAVAYLGTILFPDDELVLCLFDGHSPAAVKNANERAGIPCERIMRSIWLAPPDPAPASVNDQLHQSLDDGAGVTDTLRSKATKKRT